VGESITKSVTTICILFETPKNINKFSDFSHLSQITAAVSFSYNQIIIQKRTFFAEMPFDVLCSPKYDSSEKYF